MSTLEAEIAAAIGPANVCSGAPSTDIARRALGTPRLVVRPRSTAEVQVIVRACVAARAPMVALGRRTAYWAPLSLEGAVAIDVERLDAIERRDDGWVVGTGTAVRPLDRALRAEGLALPIHPDAFGDTSVGAMVATACTSGIGMGEGSIDDAVLGLEVVLGSGEVVRTGALAHAAPFVREGFPDATGLFLGSESTLGIVTQIALARRPAPYRVQLSARVPEASALALAALGRRWAGAYDTFRAVRTHEAGRDAPGFEVDVWIHSPWSAREAEERAREAARDLAVIAAGPVKTTPEPARARDGALPEHDARFQGPIGAHQEFAARMRLVGLDVNASYGDLPAALALAHTLIADQRARGVPYTRLALYLAPGFVNLGVHAAAPPDAPYTLDEARPFFDAFARLPIVPYRLGRAWPSTSRPAASELMRAVRASCDPHGLMHPGHPLWA